MFRERVQIGAHRILYTPDGGTEIDMGYTKEGVELDFDTSAFEREADEFAAPYDSRVDKIAITADIVLIEADLDAVSTCLGALKTTVAGPPEKNSVDLSPKRGAQMPFGKLVLRPRDLPSTDKSQDKTIWNAMVQMKSGRIFKAAEDGTINFAIKAGTYVDPVTGECKIYTEGDPDTNVTFEI